MENPQVRQRPNVLLVDDDPVLRDVLAMRLQTRGFNVLCAGSAVEAMRIIDTPHVPVDVIVMDLVLPDSWGGQVALEQVLLRPGAKVVFISGHAEVDPILAATATADAVPFLPKPFTAAQLADLIDRVLAEGTPEDPANAS